MKIKIRKVFELKSEDTFQEISPEEYSRYVVKYNDKSCENFNDIDRKYLEENEIQIRSNDGRYYAKKEKRNDFPPYSVKIDIFKLIDEWYFISYVSSIDIKRYYKCDQFEGLVKCLKEIPHWSLNIKKMQEKMNKVTTLYRPVNSVELDLIRKSGFTKFPPRLPDQPIFYPVTNKEYARQITKEWNVPAYGNGYVLEFDVNKDYLEQYMVQNVGGVIHDEYWIPSEEMEKFNKNIVGKIRIIEEY